MTNLDYVTCLINQIQNNGGLQFRPNESGKQFSIRLNSLVDYKINNIVEMSGWTKTDVISALLSCGLSQFEKQLGVEQNKKLLWKRDSTRITGQT